jgi:hypothetical protein
MRMRMERKGEDEEVVGSSKLPLEFPDAQEE